MFKVFLYFNGISTLDGYLMPNPIMPNPSKLDEPNMWDTTEEVGMNS